MSELSQSAPLVAPVAIRPPRFARAASLINKLLHRAYRLGRRHRYDEFRLERIDGVPLLVTPSVFNPKLLLTGAFFARQLDSTVIGSDAEVLDMGTGSGVCAVFAAKHARRVTAVDINAAAVRCAGINALINDLAHKIDVRQGDLFAPLDGRRFDLILFNPPFLRGEPRNDRDRAWRSSDVPERFAAGLRAHLSARGSALVLLSSFGDADSFLAAFHAQGFTVTIHAERRFVGETVAIFRLRHSLEQAYE